ncbi:MAG: hypothetical protein A2V77_11140 [Anaeromyxobacter sp. RBG_16_69_14]|nr:MAG: hypothetical protein A2V77_11140 [Anaeromyxobacter sp. RBG_16_69_14]
MGWIIAVGLGGFDLGACCLVLGGARGLGAGGAGAGGGVGDLTILTGTSGSSLTLAEMAAEREMIPVTIAI